MYPYVKHRSQHQRTIQAGRMIFWGGPAPAFAWSSLSQGSDQAALDFSQSILPGPHPYCYAVLMGKRPLITWSLSLCCCLSSSLLHHCEEPSFVSSIPPLSARDALGCFQSCPSSHSCNLSSQGKDPSPEPSCWGQNQMEYPDVVWQALCREDSPWLSVPSPAHTTPSTALVAPWENVCPWLRLLSARSQGCPTHWCLTPSALACIPSGLCLPETGLAELQGEPSACSSPSSGSLLTATWSSSVSTGPPQLDAICKHGTCALHRLLQATDRDVKQKMDSMAQITLSAVWPSLIRQRWFCNSKPAAQLLCWNIFSLSFDTH